MPIEKVKVHNKEFLKVPLMSVNQKNKVFYLAKIPAKDLINIYTVVPAIYDTNKEAAFAASFPDDAEYFKYRLDIDKESDRRDFERKLDKPRVTEIKNYLNTKEYALFPNTIIVTCDLINDLMPIPEDMKIKDVKGIEDGSLEGLSFLEDTENLDDPKYLYIPNRENSILIIDGQHRLEGLKSASADVIDNYEVLVSFIIGYSSSVIAELFYKINYTQKPVNKSLLYQLMGEFSRELDQVTFMHEVVRVLNEVDYSPFYKRVKMLGTKDHRLKADERSKMTISQAFLIDYLIGTVSSSAIKSTYPPIFLFYYRDEKRRIEIVRFLIKYFSAIKEIYKQSWENPSNSIICNTLGIGAFIKVLNFLFIKMFVSEWECDPSKISEVTIDDLIVKLHGIDDGIFSKDGEFAKGASAGSLNKLKEEIVMNIDYFGHVDYQEFYNEYKTEYLPQFRKRLNTLK